MQAMPMLHNTMCFCNGKLNVATWQSQKLFTDVGRKTADCKLMNVHMLSGTTQRTLKYDSLIEI